MVTAPSLVLQSAYGQTPLIPIPRSRPRTPFRIGFVGTITWHKDVHVLIEAVRQLPASTSEAWIFGGLDLAPGYVAGLCDRADGLPIRFMGGRTRECRRGVCRD